MRSLCGEEKDDARRRYQALKGQNIIDQRLFDWSRQLQVLEIWLRMAHAIIEYIYGLTDRTEADASARMRSLIKNNSRILGP